MPSSTITILEILIYLISTKRLYWALNLLEVDLHQNTVICHILLLCCRWYQTEEKHSFYITANLNAFLMMIVYIVPCVVRVGAVSSALHASLCPPWVLTVLKIIFLRSINTANIAYIAFWWKNLGEFLWHSNLNIHICAYVRTDDAVSSFYQSNNCQLSLHMSIC